MQNRQKIHRKIRFIVKGTSTRPRLAVYRSLTNISAQIIDDSLGKTLIGLSSVKDTGSLSKKAQKVGEAIAKAAKAQKITAVVFDRGGFAYKGSVKILAQAARTAGLEF